MLGSFLVDSDDLGHTEELISANYAKIRIAAPNPGVPTRARVWRTNVGSLDVDEGEFSYDFDYVMEPPKRVMLCRVRSGSLRLQLPGQETDTYGPGRVVAVGAQEGVSFSGGVRHALYDVVSIDRGLLDAVVGPDAPAVRLSGSTPVTNDANQLLVDAVDHLRHGLLANPHAAQQPLVAGAAARYLAATVVAALPTAGTSQPVASCADASPAVLRRAIAYIDDNAHTDIAVTDIATAAGVSPWVLRRLFRRHRDCAPMQYVRRVRLHHARDDLESGRDDAATVSEVAHRWGFGNVGRFATEYQQTYGRGPFGARPDASVTIER